MKKKIVLSFYHFGKTPNLENLRKDLLGRCTKLNLTGSILLAEEGINGSIAGEKRLVFE